MATRYVCAKLIVLMLHSTSARRGGVFVVAVVVCWAALGLLRLQAARLIQPVAGFTAGFTGSVRGIGLQPAGSILVMGELQAGAPAEERSLIRLHADAVAPLH